MIKNKCLPELVKSALILPHGNADVERSLSVNTSVVTEDRPHIGEAIVCAMNAVEFFYPVSNQPQNVPLTIESSLEVLKWHMPATKTRQGQGREREMAETTGAGQS